MDLTTMAILRRTTMTTQANDTQMAKSGKGRRHEQVSELTTIFTIRPGHTEQMRQACEQFNQMLLDLGPEVLEKSGVREWRQAIFDDGQRILLATSFETDWDPYIDDATQVLGLEPFVNWLQHTVEVAAHHEQLKGTVEAARAGESNTTELKALLQQAQAPACAFFDVLAARTVPQIRKAQRVQQAFEQVMDDPSAEQALAHPALKPLLDEAAD
jgi:hypothetical protein